MTKTERIEAIIAEFEEKFRDISHVGCNNSLPCGTMKNDVKSFLRQSLSQMSDETHEAVVVQTIVENPENGYQHVKGFNQALSEINQKKQEWDK